MAAVEYVAGGLVLLGVAFVFIDVAFRIERKHEPSSIVDFFDAIRLLFFSMGFYFCLLALNFGKAVVDNSTTNMASIFDQTIMVFTYGLVLLVVFGFVYFFVLIPRFLKKIKIEKQNDEDEIKYG